MFVVRPQTFIPTRAPATANRTFLSPAVIRGPSRGVVIMSCYRVTVLLVVICYLTARVAPVAPTSADLSLAESLYARLSGACRAILDLQYNSLSTQNEILKTMKIVQITDDDVVKSYPIDEAFRGLTRPGEFDIARQTKVIIHGYRDRSQSAVSMDVAEAYVAKKSFNVLLVDAEEMLNKRYILSVHNSRLMGKRLANLLANLENFGAHASDFHLIGISLGAHIAGWAGKYFHRYKGTTLGRITGLDPAGPCFTYAYQDQRLDKMDAAYVDVLHSNRLVQGVLEPLGHADFYINGGGPQQPGCIMPSCSHLRAAQIYAESIKNPKSFVAIQCQSWQQFESNACADQQYAVLGYGSSASTRGLYYLRTSASPPFALGMNGTKFVNLQSSDMWLNSLSFS
ncbi:lipase member I-like [Aricia agestis]|uniref:lipase member I-like n=1 Tax=Aricia agestis TaxID=91739 RepID=UPI001C201F99|nr:lipase member I-like [Aricia agestis]